MGADAFDRIGNLDRGAPRLASPFHAAPKNPAPLRGQQASFKIDSARAVLERIGDSAINLALWQRSVPDAVTQALQVWGRSTQGTVEREVAACGYRLSPFLVGIGGAARRWLYRDIDALVRQFAELSGAARLRLCFGPIRSAHCRKFHVDHFRMRLITTYVGPATEWVPNEAVARHALEYDAPTRAMCC